jgi:Pyruvate/2-oxoacid:ferredoxin oxidoreductase gamma subunit
MHPVQHAGLHSRPSSFVTVVCGTSAYGPEMRSGSAHCHVCLANERVGSPVIEHPDVLIAMNEPSLHKFAK